jgi:OOP family OmpA-OmpF porin
MRRFLVPILVVLSGCAGTELRGQVNATQGLVKRAWRQGAYTCAPRELAMAESHTQFAEQELDEGDFYRAKQELAVAKANADEALRKSPSGQCGKVDVIVEKVDTDGDGIFDDIDDCPKIPEDKDGFEDTDGCPDADNDGDKVIDWPEPKDKCPNEPAPDAADGCPPKYQLIVVTNDRIELKQTIYFDTRKTRIKPISFPLLDEVAQAMKDFGTIRVRIEGHTDSRGSDRSNLKLSQGRAESVRKYLVGRGIDPARMDARGFGETVPIADNRTKQGRSQNRRVEFIITGR